MSDAGARGALRAELALLDDLAGADPAAALERTLELQARAEALPGGGGSELVAAVLLWRAEAVQRLGQGDRAAALVHHVRRTWPRSSSELRARASWVMARVHGDLADYPAALEHALEAAGALDDDVPRRLRTRVLVKVADVLDELGALQDAREWYARAEALAVGDARLHMLVVNNRAYCELSAGNAGAAERDAHLLAELSRTYDRPLNANELDTLAHIHLLRGDPREAARVAREAVATAAQVDAKNSDDLPEYLLTLATAERRCGDPGPAARTLARARAACGADGHGDLKARLLQEEAEVLAATGDFRGAFEAHKAFHAADKDLLSDRREAQARARQAVYETSEARAEAERFREQARRDPLTGLRNRRSVGERLPELLAPHARTPGVLAAVLVDLDHFKAVNDDHSHEVGDAVLVTVARLLADVAALTDGGFAARLGGEEFLLVLPARDEERALALAERAREVVEDHDWSALVPGRGITLSAGVAFADAGSTQGTLLKSADAQLYAAKAGGRNRTSVAPGPAPAPDPGPRAALSPAGFRPGGRPSR